MSANRLSDEGREVVQLALREALKLGHNYIQPEHLLLALIRQEGGITEAALAELDVSPFVMRQLTLKVIRERLDAQLHGT